MSELKTIKDLRSNFTAIKKIVQDGVAQEPNSNTLGTIIRLLQKYEYDPKEFFGTEKGTDEYSMLELNICDDSSEQNICMKTILLINSFWLLEVKLAAKNAKEFRLFFNYIEKKVLTKFFDCLQRIYRESNEGELKEFTSGMESLEKWQQFILHLYMCMNSDIYTGANSLNNIMTSRPTILLSLVLYQHFSEKKEKFLNENPGKSFNLTITENYLLSTAILISDDYDLDEMSSELKLTMDHISKVYIEYLYNLVGLTFEQDTPNLVSLGIVSVAQLSIRNCDFVQRLIKDDYRIIQNTENSVIITEDFISKKVPDIQNKKRNCGESALAVKIKLLTLIDILLDADFEDFNENQKVEFCLYFKELIIESLNDEMINESGSLVGKQAVATAIRSISVVTLTEGTIDLLSDNFREYLFNILSWCKRLLFSKNSTIRARTFRSLSDFFTKTSYYSDDLMEAIIKSHELNLEEVPDYFDMLRGIAKIMTNVKIGESVAESFKSLIFTLFENICVENFLVSLKKTNDERKKMHYTNIDKFFRMIEVTYLMMVNDIDLLERLLVFIEKQTEVMKCTLSSDLLPSFALTLKEIIKSTDRNTLLEVFDQLEYYPFLVNFISFYFANGDADPNFEMSPIFTLLGCFSDSTILHTHFSFVSEVLGEDQDYIYDFLLPIIIRNAILPKSALETTDPDQAIFFVEKIKEVHYALSRIVSNDILINGGVISSMILQQTIGPITSNATQLKAFDNLVESDLLNKYMENMFFTMLACGKETLKQFPQLAKILSHLYDTTYSKEFPDSEQFLFSSFLELMEYAIDNEVLKVGYNECEWMENAEVNIIPKCKSSLRSQCKRVIMKILIELKYEEDSD